jgi:hypothetical protein
MGAESHYPTAAAARGDPPLTGPAADCDDCRRAAAAVLAFSTDQSNSWRRPPSLVAVDGWRVCTQCGLTAGPVYDDESDGGRAPPAGHPAAWSSYSRLSTTTLDLEWSALTAHLPAVTAQWRQWWRQAMAASSNGGADETHTTGETHCVREAERLLTAWWNWDADLATLPEMAVTCWHHVWTTGGGDANDDDWASLALRGRPPHLRTAASARLRRLRSLCGDRGGAAVTT